MNPLLTALTDPIAVGRFRFKETLKQVGRPLRDLVRPHSERFRRRAYRGHPTVTRSLVEGLRKIGASTNYNPASLSEVGEAVIVLSGLDTLERAIGWKRERRIARLLAGPNILVSPAEHADVTAAPEVDLCVTPSEWVSRCYESACPSLKGRFAAWPAGVDTDHWCPDFATRERRTVLLFDRHSKGSLATVAHCAAILGRRDYRVNVVAYGSYARDEILLNLRRASLLVGFADGESQCIAWGEAWSVDVPTLLWFQDHNTIAGRSISTSTAPYLCDSTGLFFSGVASFERQLTRWEASSESFRPRRWVLDNMSDTVCARQLCELAGAVVSTPMGAGPAT